MYFQFMFCYLVIGIIIVTYLMSRGGMQTQLNMIMDSEKIPESSRSIFMIVIGIIYLMIWPILILEMGSIK